MNMSELLSRAKGLGCNQVVIVSIYRGNPGRIRFLTPDGKEQLILFLQSAALRREIYSGPKTRMHGLQGIYVKAGSSSKTKRVAEFIGNMTATEMRDAEEIGPTDDGTNKVMFWFQDMNGDVLWTGFQTSDGAEIGPRVKISRVIFPDHFPT